MDGGTIKYLMNTGMDVIAVIKISFKINAIVEIMALVFGIDV